MKNVFLNLIIICLLTAGLYAEEKASEPSGKTEEKASQVSPAKAAEVKAPQAAPAKAEEKASKASGKIEILTPQDDVTTKQEISAAAKDFASLLPKADEINGWILKKETQYFDKENLWKYIDGAAELYIHYGFQKVAATDYKMKNTPDKTLTLDIYDMENLNQSFGIYSNERPQDEGFKFEKIGAQGYSDELSTIFFKGKYYVKISVFDVSEEMTAAKKKFSDFVEKQIKDNPVFPDALKRFPEEKKVANSEQFIKEGILGKEYLLDAFSAKYKYAEDKPVSSVFFLYTKTIKDAEDFYQKLKASYEEKKYAMREPEGYGDKCLDVLTKYNGRIIIIIQQNKMVGGWFMPEDDKESLRKIKAMLSDGIVKNEK